MTSTRLRFGSSCFATVVILLALTSAALKAFAATESVIWSFGGPSDGGGQPEGPFPDAGLVADSAGNLFGVLFDGGANGVGEAYELSPPSTTGGPWTESILWSFGNDPDDGKKPAGGLVMDQNGNLYGTNLLGGTLGHGTVYELSPPASAGGAWTESILWNFAAGTADGGGAVATLIFDRAGNLYGTTEGAGAFGHGTAFELSPPGVAGGSWIESILWSFGNGKDAAAPSSRLVADPSGNLYGGTFFGGRSVGGTVFELFPPHASGEAWTESVLWNFAKGVSGRAGPMGGGIIDQQGDLYGTTSGGGFKENGTAFKLTPPAKHGGEWKEQAIWTFGKIIKKEPPDGEVPEGGLVEDGTGNFYGATAGGGTFQRGIAFELSPAKNLWKESILWNFNPANGDATVPSSPLLMDHAGNLFGVTSGGGTFGIGTVFEIQP